MTSIETKQHKACDKIWHMYEKGEITLDQAIDQWFKTIQRMNAELRKVGLYVDG